MSEATDTATRIETLEATVAKLQHQLLQQQLSQQQGPPLSHHGAPIPQLAANGKLSASGRLRTMNLEDTTNTSAFDDPSGMITPMASTRVVTSHLVTPSDCANEICMGGAILSWIDVCAGLAAKTLARMPCVTASIDSVQFLKPLYVSSIVILQSMVNRVFTSSMEVGVRVEAEDPSTGERTHCCSAYLTFVAVNAFKPLPKVDPGHSKRQQAIYSDAAVRRQRRLEEREKLKNDPKLASEAEARRLLPITHRKEYNNPAIPYTPVPLANITETNKNNSKCTIQPQETAAHMTQIIMPQHCNSIGVTFGGRVLQWMEQCAFIVGSRVCRGSRTLLTAGLDDITFKRPTRVGDTMFIVAEVSAIFEKSVEVMISVWGEHPEVGQPFHCGDAFATVVAVDSSGEPVQLNYELQVVTPADEMRQRGAALRRERRLALRQHLKQRSHRPSLDEEVLNYQNIAALSTFTQ